MAAVKQDSAYILGVGMTKFQKPQARNDYAEMGFEAGVKAMLDAHINYDEVQTAVASYCYGDSTCGQRVLYQFGMTGIPVYNVNNNCASGSSAMVMANNFIRSGSVDCVLVVGFEKMMSGSLKGNFQDRTDPLDRAVTLSQKLLPSTSSQGTAPFAAQMFGNAANEYVRKFGATAEDFATIAEINHRHSQNNPYSQFQTVYTKDQVLNSAKIFDPLTKLQCCPTSDGAAAAVVVSKSFLDRHPSLRAQAVELRGQCLATDSPAAYSGSAMSLVGYEMTKHTASQALSQAGIRIQDIKAVELHDCFSANEMLAIDALGLSKPGKAHEYVRDGQATFGSDKAVVNPSGGLISKGHPLGATGIAQCAELVWQLRGWATNRLIPVPRGKAALQQNAGLGGACVVTVLVRADGGDNVRVEDEQVAKVTGLGYNPAVEAGSLSMEHVEKVLSRKASSPWARGVPESTGERQLKI